MLDDRSYMRAEATRPGWSMTTILLVLNGVIFFIQEINARHIGFPLERVFALSQEGLSRGFLWQPVTFQFLHGSLLHLILNLLCVYFFGRFLEHRMGPISFLKLYLISGVAGGLFQTGLGFFFPRYYGGLVVGASAGVYGLIAAFSLLEPNAIIRVWFILPIRSLYFMYIAGAISLFYMLPPTVGGGGGSRIAHAAHLGGLLAGVIFTRWDYLRDRFFPGRYSSGQSFSSPPVRPKRPRRKIVWQTRASSSSSAPPPEVSSTEFISREVDPILDKISKNGIQSLTPKEREILERARSKMGKR